MSAQAVIPEDLLSAAKEAVSAWDHLYSAAYSTNRDRPGYERAEDDEFGAIARLRSAIARAEAA
jgi:hypothetical protein